MKASLASLGPVLIGAGRRPQGRKPFAVWGLGDPHFSGAGQVHPCGPWWERYCSGQFYVSNLNSRLDVKFSS